MRTMNTTELNDTQLRQIDALENAACELLNVMSMNKYGDGYGNGELQDIYDLLYEAQAILEAKGIRAYFPEHINDVEHGNYTIDFTDEEITDY